MQEVDAKRACSTGKKLVVSSVRLSMDYSQCQIQIQSLKQVRQG